MKIDGDLNLVLPVSFAEVKKPSLDSDGKPIIDSDGNPVLNSVIEPTLYAYHTPISQPVFEANYRILAATKAAIFGKGIVFAADVGPRISALRLKDEGHQDAMERGDVDSEGNPKDGGAQSLLLEIKRLTSILAPGPAGWQMLPVDAAIAQKVIDASEWDEAANALVFFTCAYVLAKRHARKNLASVLAGILKGSITSSTPLEHCAFLQKLTKEETSEPVAEPSVPV
jgi:hypothetical protein